MTGIVYRLRRATALAAAICAVSLLGIGAAAAQTTYADCAAFDGHTFSRYTTDPVTSDTVTVSNMLDTDLVSISVEAFAGAAGDYTASVSVNGSVIYSQTFSGFGNGNGSASYDPPSDMTGVQFLFDTEPFNNPEAQISFQVSCTPGAASIDTPTTPTTPSTPSTGDMDDDDTDDPDTTDTTDTTIPTVTTVSQTFVTERMRRLLEERPDRARYVRKRLKALWGSDSTNDVALADSLTRAAAKAQSAPVRVASAAPTGKDMPVLVGMAARDASLRAYAYQNSDVNEGCGIDSDGLPTLGCLDVWTEAHYMGFTDDGERNGRFAVGYVGVDAHISPWIVIGVLGQMDWMTDDIDGASSKTEGIGWMAGPYATARLTPELFLDLRAAWGWSDTDITTLGTTGNFATERWLASAQLTGNFQMGNWRISPEVAAEYIEEVLDDFTLATGATIGSQRFSIGRVRFGPEIATVLELGDGVTIEPRVAVRGIWDFDPAEDITLGAITYNDDTLRGVVEAGAILVGLDGFNISVSGKYDGIGVNGFDAYGGYLWVNAPL